MLCRILNIPDNVVELIYLWWLSGRIIFCRIAGGYSTDFSWVVLGQEAESIKSLGAFLACFWLRVLVCFDPVAYRTPKSFEFSRNTASRGQVLNLEFGGE